MKKIHKKIAFNKARYLDKVVGDIESMKFGRKMRRYAYNEKPMWSHYSRGQRTEIYNHNGPTYQPMMIKQTIKGMSDLQKAKLMRAIYPENKDTSTKGMGRLRRVWGNFHSVKQPLCDILFAKKVKAQ